MTVLLAFAAAAGGCAQSATLREVEVVRIDGSAGVMPLAAALAREYRVKNPTATIALGAGLGGRQRLDSLTAGRIDIALASVPVAREELARRAFTAHEVARVAVVFATHVSVGVSALTQTQICDAYARRVTNWSQLGGADLPIAARSRPAGEVDGDVAVAGVPCLASATTAGAPRSLEKPEDMASELASVPGALGMTSLPFVEQSAGRIRALRLDGVEATAETVRTGAYPLVRPAVFLTRADVPRATARFLAFVRSDDGARVIVANGGVPLR